MPRVFILLSVAALCAGHLAAQNVGYVVDNALGQVKVVDLSSRRVSATISTGREASEILILANNRLAFVANQADNNVALVDLNANTLLATIAVGQAPADMVASNDGRFLYVADEGSNDVAVIDIAARSVITTIPVDATPVQVNMSPDGNFVYAVNRDATPTGTISVIDVRLGQVVKTLPVGSQPVLLAIAPTLTTAYVINSVSDSVSVIDLATNVVTATFGVGHSPTSAAFSTDGRFLYIVNRASNSISVVDTRQNRVLAQIPVGTQPAAMVVTFDSKFGYVSNQGSNSVNVLDLTTNTNEDTVAVGSVPFDIELDPNENFLYVTNVNSQSLTVIDVDTDRVVATIPVGGAPVQFSFLNAPTLLELAPNPATAGSSITLNGEGFLPSSMLRIVTASGTTPVRPTFLDSEGLQIFLPPIPGSGASVVVDNPDGNSSETLSLRIGSTAPSILPGGVVDSAGFPAAPYPISGGAAVSVFGNYPGVTTQQAQNFPLPTALSGARVTFNGIPAPMYYVRSDIINVVAPFAIPQPTVRVAVTLQDQTSAVETVNTASSSPAIFLIDTAGNVAARHAFRLLDIVTPADPAQRGELVAMYVTGLGPTSPPSFDAIATRSDVYSFTVAQPVVTIAGINAQVQFSGLTPGVSGLYQINVWVPDAAPSGSVDVTVTIGALTSNRARLAVK